MRPDSPVTAAQIAAQEEERARLARELHDGAVQEVIALIQRVDRIERHLERGDGVQAIACAQSMRQALLGLAEELRTVIGDLRPPALQELGLVRAVAMLVHRADPESLAVTMQVEGTEQRLGPAQELAAYRIVQEAWSNVLRHACARHVVITIQYTREGLVVSVRDDGVGFSLEHASRTGHWGLRGMQERAELAGGRLELRGTPDSGTELTAYLPVSHALGHLPAPMVLPSTPRTRRGRRPAHQMAQLA
jgi:two-component system, NarL family, sensor histidine kinase DegS